MTTQEQLQPGPCISCGATNYSLSMGGPLVCSMCDCRPPSMKEIRLLHEDIAQLEEEVRAAYTKGREDTTKEVYRWLNAMYSHNELTGTEQEGYEVAIEHVRIHLQALKGDDNDSG